MSAPRQLRRCGGCGSQWFRLREVESGAGFMDGTVCVDEHGAIAHYSGVFECARCGARLDPSVAGEEPNDDGHLRIVAG